MDKRVSILKPTFYMMVGLPAAGKSIASIELKKYLASLKRKSIIISPKEVSKDLLKVGETYDKNELNDAIFKKIRHHLSLGVDVIYDDANLRRKNRKHLLRQLPDCNKVATIVWARYETCVVRDKKRSQSVGEEVIEQAVRSFHSPYYDEGWDNIAILLADEKYTEEDYKNWMDCPHDNPHHLDTVGEHTQKVVELALEASLKETEGQKYQSALMYALLSAAASVHDIGKKFTKTFVNAKGEKSKIAHYYDHHRVGAWFALGYDGLDIYTEKDKIMIVWLVNVHMEPALRTWYYNSLPKELKCIVDKFREFDMKGR